MSVFSEEESEVLDRIAIDALLDRLSPPDRAMIEMRFVYRVPEGYAGPWPPRRGEIGRFVGERYFRRALGETTVMDRIGRILALWRRLYHGEPVGRIVTLPPLRVDETTRRGVVTPPAPEVTLPLRRAA